jgi:hypothetical protein
VYKASYEGFAYCIQLLFYMDAYIGQAYKEGMSNSVQSFQLPSCPTVQPVTKWFSHYLFIISFIMYFTFVGVVQKKQKGIVNESGYGLPQGM